MADDRRLAQERPHLQPGPRCVLRRQRRWNRRFGGLTSKLDYLASLNVTCVWLLPFDPSPNRDNGYDTLDSYGVDDRLGTLGDFVEFTRQARERGIRIVDLVMNHKSIDHPWFDQARRDGPHRRVLRRRQLRVAPFGHR